MKTLIITTLILGIFAYNKDVNALRCGTKIISEGSTYSQVIENCNIKSEYQVNNSQADIKEVNVKKGGMNNRIKIIDGKVYYIKESRF